MHSEPTSQENAYNAGLLDGEGHISVSDRPSGRGGCVTVGMTNTDLELLNPFLVYGGTIGKPRIRGYGNKPQYGWAASSRNAITALEAMLPYLIRLKRKAELALIILKATPKKGKHLTEDQADLIEFTRKQFYAG